MTDPAPSPTSPDHSAAEEFVARAGHHLPSWLRPGDPESRLPVLVAIIAVMALQLAIPQRYSAIPRWPLLTLEFLLLIVQVVINPRAFTRETTIGRWASIALVAAITLDDVTSAVVLDARILSGQVSNDVAKLLGGGAAVFATSVIAFGIWYWELDRGGPFARRSGSTPYPDFLFPQMSDPNLARPDWRPTFVDYLYVSFTNSVAFSPTDTMPLSRWAKLMMSVQALIATSTIALVIARAVNVL